MESGKKVLVTGISGFLGSHVALQLLEKGYFVRGTVRDKSNKKKVDFLKNLPHQEHLEIVEADLLKPESLEAAVTGCNYVIHVASPFPADSPKDESVLIVPAVEGTKSVLKACSGHKEVKHVVITSSIVAIMSLSQPEKEIYTEKDWANVEGNTPYNKSKILAEKAAWEFYKTIHETKDRFALTTINPGFILGPSLSGGDFTSADRIIKILTGELKFLPKLALSIADVRDVAAAHIAAIESSISDGQRYICYSGETLWFEDIANILRAEYGAYGYKIPNFVLNDCPIKDETNPLKMYWGKSFKMDNTKAKTELGIAFKPAKESILKMAASLIEYGAVPNLIKKS